MGGALMVAGTTFIARGCRFFKNSVVASTGLGAGQTIVAQGGAIYLNAVRLTDMSATNLTYNRVIAPTSLSTSTSTYTASGGGIAVSSGILRLNSSVIAYNRVESSGPPSRGNSDATGGGVYYSGTSTIVAKNSRFYGNRVVSNYTASGGAIGGVGMDVTLLACPVFSNSVSGRSHL
jgi:hypothetical protein